MLIYAQYNCIFLQYLYNILIIIVSSCPIIIEQPSFTISQLSVAARAYFNLGISNSTRKAYTAGIRKYIAFCFEINQPPIPVCEDTLMLFVTYLAQQNLSYATIQVYLSAVRYSGIKSAKSTTLRTPRLNYILKGIRKESAVNHQPRERRPITFPIMKRLHMVLSQHPGNYNNTMIWAACCLAYFGLLRVSEFTTSSPDHFDSTTDLLLSDVALDSRESPTTVQITLKKAKNDQFRKGHAIYLGKTTHAVCPVDALVQYLAIRGGIPGPLFLLDNNQSLTRASFSSALKKAFQELHMDHQQFNTHSFRIGAATSAKRAGVSDSHLKAMGRWKSDAYLKYVQLSPKDLAMLSNSLASSERDTTTAR